MIGATDEQMVAMTEWLNAQGFGFDMRDGLWMEEYLQDYKWRDIFDMMASWHAEQAATPCTWTHDGDADCKWDAGCGESFLFLDDGPVENDYRHCPGCGGVITIPAVRDEE